MTAELSWDDERTPTTPHERPAPVVVRSGTLGAAPRPPPLPPRVPRATPQGGLLAPLGTRPPPHPLSDPAFARLARNWAACPEEDRRLIEALALRLRPASDGGR